MTAVPPPPPPPVLWAAMIALLTGNADDADTLSKPLPKMFLMTGVMIENWQSNSTVAVSPMPKPENVGSGALVAGLPAVSSSWQLLAVASLRTWLRYWVIVAT